MKVTCNPVVENSIVELVRRAIRDGLTGHRPSLNYRPGTSHDFFSPLLNVRKVYEEEPRPQTGGLCMHNDVSCIAEMQAGI